MTVHRALYVARRLGLAVVVLFAILMLTFVVSRAVPSDPAALWAGPRATADQIAAARVALGLDQPLWRQFGDYLGQVLRGDFGVSFATKRPIAADISTYLTATLEPVILAMLLAVVVGLPLGVLCAARRDTLFDRIVSGLVSVVFVSIPVYWFALLLQLLLFQQLHLLPIGGRTGDIVAIEHPITPITGFALIDSAIQGNGAGFADAAQHLVMPVLVLAAYPAGLVLRMTRASMADTLDERYILAQRSFGIPERSILFRYALRNAVIPIVTVLGLCFAYLVTGAFLVEAVFSWQGLGSYVAAAVSNLDFPVIVAVALVVAVAYVGINLVVDLVQNALDPRRA